VLALLTLGLHDHGRAWKGFDWDALSRLHEKGFISSRTRSARQSRCRSPTKGFRRVAGCSRSCSQETGPERTGDCPSPLDGPAANSAAVEKRIGMGRPGA
jgi:hypothetical protein